ncbi:MAG: F0F1 ATP synthase subunit delta [Pseudomonadota bacterium]
MTSEHQLTAPPSRTGPGARYAEALFDLAKEENAIGAIETDAAKLRAAVSVAPDFQRFLRSPVYDREDKSRAIAALAAKLGVSALTSNFLGVVAGNGRLYLLETILSALEARLAQERGEVSAEAISAAPLSEEQQKRLRGEIERMVGKAVKLVTRVDPELLGGLIVKVGSTMVDSSLRTKLNKLKTAMKEA